MKLRTRFSLAIAVLVTACNTPQKEQSNLAYSQELHTAQQALTDAMVHDIFAPPLASRTYAYANIAAYYALCGDPSVNFELANKLNEFPTESIDNSNQKIDYQLAAILSFYEVAEKLVFTADSVELAKNQLLKKAINHAYSEEVINASKAYALLVVDQISDWAKEDGYKTIRANDGYLLSDQFGAWQPTPPSYHEPISPNWNKLRPFYLDSATQFKPPPPPEVSMDPKSKFYKDLMQVYETGNQLNEEQREIAGFWDCNPFAVQEKGHLMVGVKKISPGGHWMGITQMILKREKAEMEEATKTYAYVASTLADAFISCWDEKYRSNYIRPITIINRELDPNWEPLLQTPPFPEYTSGHSVISTAASVMLTALYGDNYSFTDSVEVVYGLPARSFSSFRDAAAEAAISRLYGGIHYMPAITLGVKQGEKVGNFIVEKTAIKKG